MWTLTCFVILTAFSLPSGFAQDGSPACKEICEKYRTSKDASTVYCQDHPEDRECSSNCHLCPDICVEIDITQKYSCPRSNNYRRQVKDPGEEAKDQGKKTEDHEEKAKVLEEKVMVSEEKTKVPEEKVKVPEEKAKAPEEKTKAPEEKAKVPEDQAEGNEDQAKIQGDPKQNQKGRSFNQDRAVRNPEAQVEEKAKEKAEEKPKARQQQNTTLSPPVTRNLNMTGTSTTVVFNENPPPVSTFAYIFTLVLLVVGALFAVSLTALAFSHKLGCGKPKPENQEKA